jgi:hypothetical protein
MKLIKVLINKKVLNSIQIVSSLVNIKKRALNVPADWTLIAQIEIGFELNCGSQLPWASTIHSK